ncbi:MAG: DUF5615 family PIN-like protein [Akkermansiaceae bacterium]|nr:DUF5615 family PIN-like protein [Akkermansiaceae bacterium]
MKFFLDENFPKAAVGLLEGMGHEVFDLRGSGREGLPDPDIFAEAHSGIGQFSSATNLGSQSLRWTRPVDSTPGA